MRLAVIFKRIKFEIWLNKIIDLCIVSTQMVTVIMTIIFGLWIFAEGGVIFNLRL